MFYKYFSEDTMYIRKATLKSLNLDDYYHLANFVHSLRTHSMYRPIVEDLIAKPGFVKKEYIMQDTKEGQTFFSLIAFENKESFDVYMNEESSQSLWVYLEIMATQENISFQVDDYETT